MVMPSGMAVTRHRDIDDVRLDAALFFVPKTPVAQNARTEILDHDVRNRDQPLDDLETLRSTYVKADALLVDIRVVEVSRGVQIDLEMSRCGRAG
jgi:hypothetical protein